MVLFNDGLLCLAPVESEEEGANKYQVSRYKFDFKWLDNLVGATVTLSAVKTRGQFCIVFKSDRKDYTFFFTDRSKQTQWYDVRIAFVLFDLPFLQVRGAS
jgi:hypothetical protein